MIKFSFKLAAFFVLFISSVAHAGLIKSDLTVDNYVTIGDLDWTWASSENASHPGNTIYSPDLILGLPASERDEWERDDWRHATIDELSYFISNRVINIALFSYKNASGDTLYKNSFVYWNTFLEEVTSDDVNDFNAGLIETYLVGDIGGSSWAYETFYVRDTPSDVPEPSTLLIFAIALIALSLRKRAIK